MSRVRLTAGIQVKAAVRLPRDDGEKFPATVSKKSLICVMAPVKPGLASFDESLQLNK